ncbi:MAG TPA: PadR family transcriptional regulator [Acidobacteriota bacterium]|nr:PadR family transcriptional regulator [Acidobacteriota bacterium]
MQVKASEANIEKFLPLRPLIFAVLLGLGQSERHGYAIMQDANERLSYRAIVGPGTLYRTLKELREQGLIEPCPSPPGKDARRQYYRLTDLGRQVAEAEALRLSGLVEQARAERLLEG